MSLAIRHSPAGSNPRRVFLAVPSYGPLSAQTAMALFRAHPFLLEHGWDVELSLLMGDCHVDDARNTLVNQFLESDCSDFVFIDSDMGFQSKDLLRLLEYDRDVVGAAYPRKSEIETYTAMLKHGEIWSDRDGLIECVFVGTGFLRIRRNVLEKLAASAEMYRTYGEDDHDIAMVFNRTIIDGARVSGDVNFCYKWRDAGGKIYIDPECYVEHVGEKIWSGTYATFLRKKSGLDLKEGLERIRAGTETDKDYITLMLEWGNDGFAAGPELVKAAVGVARQSKGAVLETGTGLTTLVMAAANPDLEIHSLEHKWEWASKTEQAIQRLGLTNVTIHRVNLVDTPAGKWYDVPYLPWEDVGLVLCDGPPRQEGNRRILFGVMATHNCRPKCILVDDADTEGDSIPAPYRTEIKGYFRKFAVGLR